MRTGPGRALHESPMSSYSAPNTSQSGTTTVDPQRQNFNPYSPGSDAAKDEGVLGSADSPKFPNAPLKSSRFEGARNVYNAVSRIFGFDEKYSLALCASGTLILPSLPSSLRSLAVIFFVGALIGFCLARTIMMSPGNLRDLTIPGRCLPTCA